MSVTFDLSFAGHGNERRTGTFPQSHVQRTHSGHMLPQACSDLAVTGWYSNGWKSPASKATPSEGRGFLLGTGVSK